MLFPGHAMSRLLYSLSANELKASSSSFVLKKFTMLLDIRPFQTSIINIVVRCEAFYLDIGGFQSVDQNHTKSCNYIYIYTQKVVHSS